MKVFLDDERSPQQVYGEGTTGWTCCRWPDEVIALLQAGGVDAVSLDYYLGEGPERSHPRTGIDVLHWLEQRILISDFPIPRISVHTRGWDKRAEMAEVIKRIMEAKERLSLTK